MGIRVIGCGAMGSAIAQTLAENGQEISLYDKHSDRAIGLARAISAHVCHSPLEGTSREDFLLIAVKPQDLESIAKDLEGFEGKLIISILTGVTIEQLKAVFPDNTVLRMMPNLAVRYGDGIVALAEDSDLLYLKDEIEKTFAPLGLVRWFPEKHLNAVTALSGSGPAFVFAIVEAMVDAAIAMGFSADEGYELVKHMLGGSLTTLYESNELPAELRWRVASPAGTTIAGLHAFEANGIRGGIMDTFLAAFERAQELGS